MIGGDLFQRFFLRFMGALLAAFALLILLIHLFQKQVVNAEWRADLQQEASWIARHFGTGEAEPLARAWGTTHRAVRLMIFDDEWRLVADSQDDRALPDVERLRQGGAPPGYLVAVEPLANGGRLVLARPWIPPFPAGRSWQLVAGALVIVALVVVSLYPLVRSMSSTFKRMTELAEEVAAGHFGKTLGLERSDELGRLVEAFDDMSEKLAEAERLNTRLLHDVSHELRSPLGRIQVLAQTIGNHPEEAEACIRGIDQEVALLDRLVGDLLQAARIESAARAPRFTSFSLTQWATETLGRLEGRCREAGIAWEVHIPADDLEVRGDPQRLAQAVGNLVDNSVAALAGRPDPAIEVALAAEGDGAGWRLTVRDNGRGVPEADLPHLFRRFYRVGDDRSRDRGGVGLGLSLVRAIAQAHGGTASITSRLGAGTEVTLRFLARDEADGLAAPAGPC